MFCTISQTAQIKKHFSLLLLYCFPEWTDRESFFPTMSFPEEFPERTVVIHCFLTETLLCLPRWTNDVTWRIANYQCCLMFASVTKLEHIVQIWKELVLVVQANWKYLKLIYELSGLHPFGPKPEVNAQQNKRM